MRWLLAIAIALIGVVVVQEPVHADPTSTRADDGPVLVVMDTSGSMSEDSGTVGSTKIEAARSAILQLVAALPSNSDFGLIAYPGRNARVENGCAIGHEEVPLGPLDQVSTSAAVRKLTPDGDTPTAPALDHAAGLLTARGSAGTIVLVSDGESNCGATDVCEVARQISASGIEVRVNTVGLRINETGRSELECVASTTGGRYVPAEDANAMAAAIQELSGARLQVSATVPRTIPVVSGTGTSGTRIPITVTSNGQNRADDVRVTLDFTDQDGNPGSVSVPRPVRFLGNLDPGQSRAIEIIVRPDTPSLGKHTWTVYVTAANTLAAPATGETFVSTETGELTGILDGVSRIAVVGDSYSSGEGAGEYDSGTDGNGGNKCHRSEHAYGRVLKVDDARLIACSGAVTADFYARQNSGGQRVTPQLRALRDVAVSRESPQAVFLSIGGNDIGFGEVAARCILSPIPCDEQVAGQGSNTPYEQEIGRRISAAANNLRRVYRDVDRAVNDPDALRERGDRAAPVVVVPYPRLVPVTTIDGAGPPGCQAGIDGDELSMLNRVIDELNGTIALAADILRREGRPVYVASDVVQSFQPNHTICDDDTYGVAFGDLLDAASISDIHELLHPNSKGHEAMARAITAWASNASAITVEGTVDWEESTTNSLNPVANWYAHQTMSAADVYELGGTAEIDQRGIAPSSTVVFRIDSLPRNVGSAVADENGTVRAAIQIPPDLETGNHHLVITGIDSDGNSYVQSREIRVVRPYTSLALTALILGLLLTLIPVVGFIRRARKRSRAA